MDLPWQAVVSAENLGASMTVVGIVSFGSISARKRMSPHTSLSKSEERNQKKSTPTCSFKIFYHNNYCATYVTNPCSIIPPNKHAVV